MRRAVLLPLALAACGPYPLPLPHAFDESAFLPAPGGVEIAGSAGALAYGVPDGPWTLDLYPLPQGHLRFGLGDHVALRLTGSEAGVGPALEVAVRAPAPFSPWQWNLQFAPEVEGGVEWIGGQALWDVAPGAAALFSLRPTETSALTLGARFTRTFAGAAVQSATTLGLGYAVRVGKVELRPGLTFGYLRGADKADFTFYEVYPSLAVAAAAR